MRSSWVVGLFAVLSFPLAVGCSAGEVGSSEPNGAHESSSQVDDLVAGGTAIPKGINYTRAYFGDDNTLWTSSDVPWAYALFDLSPKASIKIDLKADSAETAGGVGFKLYRVKGDGKLTLLKKVDGPLGEATASLKSTSGGTYVVEAVANNTPALLHLSLGCTRQDGKSCTPAGQPGDGCGSKGLSACTDGLFCQYGPDCGATDKGGVCAKQTKICPLFFKPVCGCDGKTYSNTCSAAAAGVSVTHDGACEAPQPEPGKLCGGIAGFQCGAGQICKMAAGTCNIADNAGTCAPKPDFCPQIYKPVCGCNGKTYTNECSADAAGVAVDHTGACK